jgi:hypothetical protein
LRARTCHAEEPVAGNAEADLDLGAHGHPFDVTAEHVGEEAIVLVPAVVADLLAKQARRHAEPDAVARVVRRRHAAPARGAGEVARIAVSASAARRMPSSMRPNTIVCSGSMAYQ